MENKRVLAYMIQSTLPPYKELSIEDILDRFLSNSELEERGEENREFVERNAELPWREPTENSYALYNLSIPGLDSLSQVLVRVFNDQLTRDDDQWIFNYGFFTTMEKFSSNALLGSTVYDFYGNPVKRTDQFIILVNPVDEISNNVVSPEFGFTTEAAGPTSEARRESYPVPSPYHYYMVYLGHPDLITEELIAEEKGNIGLKVLDLIFTRDMKVEDKVKVLNEDYGIVFNDDEILDLEIITNFVPSKEDLEKIEQNKLERSDRDSLDEDDSSDN